MGALASTPSPVTRLAGRAPPATTGCTSTIGIRPITYDKLPVAAGHEPARGHCPSCHSESMPEPLSARNWVALRESYPPVHDPSGPARAARVSTWADAEPALVMAPRDAGAVRGDRPGRLGAGRAGARRLAGRGPAGAIGHPRRGPPVPAAAQRRGRRPTRVQLRPALVPDRAGAGRGAGGRGGLPPPVMGQLRAAA